MNEISKSQRARIAIREFKTITDAVAIRGFYQPAGRFGKTLEACLRDLSPEIYGSMNDPKVVELKGLEYVIDRLPKGIEEVTKVILTDEDQFEDTPFKKIIPLKRRRISYRISKKELCFIVSRGVSEIYDIITHMVFLNVEAKKIYKRTQDDYGKPRLEWKELINMVNRKGEICQEDLDSALWNLSIIIGRTYHETRESYEYLEKNRKENKSNNGLFSFIYHLAKGVENEKRSQNDARVVYLTPSLMKIIGHQKYGRLWALDIKEKLVELNLQDRPLHIISSNLHSVVNVLYGYGAVEKGAKKLRETEFYSLFPKLIDKGEAILDYGEKHGLISLPDRSGVNIDCQIIDTSKLGGVTFHPDFHPDTARIKKEKPVLVVMDYAFGAQAFELMEQLLKPFKEKDGKKNLHLGSISIMGKAGILSGDKGDVMLATAHVCEGDADNYIFKNDLTAEKFDKGTNVFVGPMATVVGTSLQNRDVLEMFKDDWHVVGLEMEGGHYQKAINAAVIKGNITKEVKTRYAYYASDNPLMTGSTLAAGAMGEEGIKPTYMISRLILEKILGIKGK